MRSSVVLCCIESSCLPFLSIGYRWLGGFVVCPCDGEHHASPCIICCAICVFLCLVIVGSWYEYIVNCMPPVLTRCGSVLRSALQSRKWRREDLRFCRIRSLSGCAAGCSDSIPYASPLNTLTHTYTQLALLLTPCGALLSLLQVDSHVGLLVPLAPSQTTACLRHRRRRQHSAIAHHAFIHPRTQAQARHRLLHHSAAEGK